MKKREKKRPPKGFCLWSAIVWTGLAAVRLYEFFRMRKLAARGFAALPGGLELLFLGALFLCFVGLAVSWWVQWARYDKNDRD